MIMSLFCIHFNPRTVITHAPALEILVKGLLEHFLGFTPPTSIFPLGAAMNTPQRGASNIWVGGRHGVNRVCRCDCGRPRDERLGGVDDHLRDGVERFLRSLVPLIQ